MATAAALTAIARQGGRARAEVSDSGGRARASCVKADVRFGGRRRAAALVLMSARARIIERSLALLALTRCRRRRRNSLARQFARRSINLHLDGARPGAREREIQRTSTSRKKYYERNPIL